MLRTPRWFSFVILKFRNGENVYHEQRQQQQQQQVLATNFRDNPHPLLPSSSDKQQRRVPEFVDNCGRLESRKRRVLCYGASPLGAQLTIVVATQICFNK